MYSGISYMLAASDVAGLTPLVSGVCAEAGAVLVDTTVDPIRTRSPVRWHARAGNQGFSGINQICHRLYGLTEPCAYIPLIS